MKAIELSRALGWELVCGDGEREIAGGVYCCDLLSIVMGRAPADCLWVTVMGNVNAAAVATIMPRVSTAMPSGGVRPGSWWA